MLTGVLFFRAARKSFSTRVKREYLNYQEHHCAPFLHKSLECKPRNLGRILIVMATNESDNSGADTDLYTSQRSSWMSTETLVTCGKCRRSVRLLEKPPRRTSDSDGQPQVRKALQCKHCGNGCCRSCQSSDISCSCGQRAWKKVYFEDVDKPSWWTRLLRR